MNILTKYHLDRAKETNASHIIVIHDGFDFESYAVYIQEHELQDTIDRYNDGDTVLEVFSVNDLEKGLKDESRV